MQIILKLTTECNLACSYCSEGDKAPLRLPEAIFSKLVDDIPAFSKATGETRFDFLFHGGEPLLYGRDKIKRLIDCAREKLAGLELHFLMQTNGTLIDKAWIDFFKQEKISPGISLDGYPEIHDKYRKTKADEPTAQKILDNIKTMREAGLQIGTLMVLNSDEEVDADKLFSFLVEEDFSPKIHAVIPCGRAAGRQDTKAVYDKYVELMQRLCELALTNNMKKRIQPLDELMDAILGLSPLGECSFNGSCGKSFICLYPDGDMGFCGRAGVASDLIYGNIMSDSLLELCSSVNAEKIRERQNYLKANDCRNCSEWNLCHGGCAFEALNSTGTLNTKFPHCIGRRRLIKYLRNDGVRLLKEALVQEKMKHRRELQYKKKIWQKVAAIDLREVIDDAGDES